MGRSPPPSRAARASTCTSADLSTRRQLVSCRRALRSGARRRETRPRHVRDMSHRRSSRRRTMTCSSGRTTPASYSTRLRAARLWSAAGAGAVSEVSRALSCRRQELGHVRGRSQRDEARLLPRLRRHLLHQRAAHPRCGSPRGADGSLGPAATPHASAADAAARRGGAAAQLRGGTVSEPSRRLRGPFSSGAAVRPSRRRGDAGGASAVASRGAAGASSGAAAGGAFSEPSPSLLGAFLSGARAAAAGGGGDAQPRHPRVALLV